MFKFFVQTQKQKEIRLWATPFEPSLTKAGIKAYARDIDAVRYPYFCSETGMQVKSIREVIRESVYDFVCYGCIHRWKITRNWQ